MSAVFDSYFVSGDAVFDASFADAPAGSLTLVTDIDAGNVSQGSTTITGADTSEPVVNLAHRPDAGNWRHLHFAVENAEGKRPIFKAPRTTRYTNSDPSSEYRPVWTQDFVTWTRAPSRTLSGGTSGTIDWQFTDPLPAGRVYIATQPLGRQADAVALTSRLLTTYSSVASPTASADAGGVFFTSPAENDGTGRACGGHPLYAVDLKFGGATTDGGPKRKLVVIAGIHAAGEATSWIPFMRFLDYILDSSDAPAVAVRANWDITCYYNITPNGVYSGDNRTNPSRGSDPNRIWDAPNVEIAATQAAILDDIDGGRFDAFFSWHGWSSSTNPFLMYLIGPEYTAGTRSALTQAFIDEGTTIFGGAPSLSTSGTNNTDVWWAITNGAAFAADTEVQQNGSTAASTYQLTGESWAKTLQAVDAAGEFWESTGAASGTLNATISDVTATLEGTAGGGAGVSGELHTTLTDITATLTGTAGGAGVSGELHSTLSDATATLEGSTAAVGELHASTSDVIAILAGYVTITGELHATVSDIIAMISGVSLGPAGVDLEIVKRWCRIDGSEFDVILPMMVSSAVALAEQETGRDYSAEEMPPAVLQFVCAHVSYWINTPDAALEKSMMPSPFVARLLDPYRLWEMT